MAIKLAKTFFWRRLDQPGHDVCHLFQIAEGWRLTGVAVFFEAGCPNDLQYEVIVNKGWKTLSATVRGYRAEKHVDLAIQPIDQKIWQVGTVQVNMPTNCLDIDLGFTPATNMIAIRRLALRVGQQAESPAAWLNHKTMRLSCLPQRYCRVDKTRFKYEAPTVGYANELQVSAIGAVVRYPGLFELLD